MSINTQELFDLKAQKHNSSSQSEHFTKAFFYAITRVIGDLNSPLVGSGLGITSIPEDVEENIVVDAAYFGVVSAGIDLYLKDTGEWGQQSRDEAEAAYSKELRKAQAICFNATPPKTRNQSE